MELSPGSMLVNVPCNEVLTRVRRSLERVGLRALETFDLQIARSSGAECTCPHHGTTRCDCQMVVLLIYGEGTAPTPLMLHGSDGRTWISLPDDRACGLEPLLEVAIAASMGDERPAEGL